MDIVKAIYDMMGKYTYPVLKEDAPRQHVEVFFQVLTFYVFFLILELCTDILYSKVSPEFNPVPHYIFQNKP